MKPPDRGLARFRQVQPALAYAARHLDEDLSLGVLADQAGLSACHLHRVFSAAAGETPKQLTLRLRLSHASTLLLTTNHSILDVAIASGFQSHEVFLRAFRRRFGLTPGAYRRRGFTGEPTPAGAQRHAGHVTGIGPCIGLYHLSDDRRTPMSYEIEQRILAPQPVLYQRRRVNTSEIGQALGEMLPSIFVYAQQAGLALAGQPFTRYVEWGPGVVTIEAGLPIDAAPESASVEAVEAGGVISGTLPGGPAAIATHVGPYEKLMEAHAALQQWIEARGLKAAGPAWEVYVTDPADYPDPSVWITYVFWPIVANQGS